MRSYRETIPPILLLIYNRPDTTASVFSSIRSARPVRLYVAGDGPRANCSGERSRVEEARGIVRNVDWPCEVFTLFRSSNLGCCDAVSEAISWFFEAEESGIILEDDCLPSQSFFSFCSTLLERYRDEPRVFNITGLNRQGEWKPHRNDYFFSATGGISGWATWRRAWMCFEKEMDDLEAWAASGFLERKFGQSFGKLRLQQLLRAKRRIREGSISSWAYPWAYTRHKHDGLAIVPSKNLITNIGFGELATHTKGVNDCPVERFDLPVNLRVNSRMTPDLQYDLRFLGHKPFLNRLWGKLTKTLTPKRN